MRQAAIFLIILATSQQLSAQLYITPGAALHLTDTVTLTLQNIGFTNHGAFFPDSSIVFFSGSNSHIIAGNQPISFYEMHINKTGGGEIVLQRPISVGNRIFFDNGYLSIGNHDVQLGRTAILQSEFENERLRSTGTGRVIAARTINGGVNQLPGNMGVSITTDAHLGDVIIQRGHQPQSGNGLMNSIQRYYEISPQHVPPGAAATVRLSYFDAELNGLDENTLQIYQSTDGTNWTMLPVSMRQTTNDYVEVEGVQLFGFFTLAAPSGPLPVHYALFNSRCDNGRVVLTWHTGSEQGSQRFAVQQSTDGSRWTEVGSVPAAGFSNTQRVYNFSPNNAAATGFYRLAEYSTDGRIQYSGVLRSSCNGVEKVMVWPNPTPGNVFTSFVSGNAATITISVYDEKGALVKEKRATVLPGSNQLTIDLSSLSVGLYTIVTEGTGIKNSTKVYKR